MEHVGSHAEFEKLKHDAEFVYIRPNARTFGHIPARYQHLSNAKLIELATLEAHYLSNAYPASGKDDYKFIYNVNTKQHDLYKDGKRDLSLQTKARSIIDKGLERDQHPVGNRERILAQANAATEGDVLQNNLRLREKRVAYEKNQHDKITETLEKHVDKLPKTARDFKIQDVDTEIIIAERLLEGLKSKKRKLME